jgi:hypothetical protein
MAATVDFAFVPALQDTLTNLYEEDGDNLRDTVRVRTNVVGKSDNWERLSGVEMIPVTGRHQATPHTPMTHSRRRSLLSDFVGVEYLDDLDKVKMMIDPKNDYSQNLMKAWQRRVARTTVTALNAAAIVVANDDSTTTQALPASQSIANGGTGFTMAKWRQANRILDNAGVDRDGNRTVLLSAFAIEDLLADTQITNSDYTQLNAITTGTIPNGARVMGCRVIMISDAIPDDSAVLTGGTANPILPKTGNIRTCFMYHKTAVGLSIAWDGPAEVDKRPDLMNSWQVMRKGSLGAVRVLDAGVVQIDIDESA